MSEAQPSEYEPAFIDRSLGYGVRLRGGTWLSQIVDADELAAQDSQSETTSQQNKQDFGSDPYSLEGLIVEL